jgi:hypothetical protein
MTWLVLVIVAVIVAAAVGRLVIDWRWLRAVRRASGDPQRLAQLIYGPRRRKGAPGGR